MSNSITLKVNQSVSITTMITDAYGAAASAKTINYVVDNPNIIMLANNGTFVSGSVPQNSVSTNTITALANGTAIITITIDGGTVVSTITVVVSSPSPGEITIVFGTPTP